LPCRNCSLGTLENGQIEPSSCDRRPRRRFRARPEIVNYLGAVAQKKRSETDQAGQWPRLREALQRRRKLDQANDIAKREVLFQLYWRAENRQVWTKKGGPDLPSANQSRSIRRHSAEACNYLGILWADHNMKPGMRPKRWIKSRPLRWNQIMHSYLDGLGFFFFFWVECGKGKLNPTLEQYAQLRQRGTSDHDDPVHLSKHMGAAYF